MVWCGTDDDRMAAVVRCDLTALDRVAEVVALLKGRHTYDLVGNKRGGYRLYYREPWHVKAKERKHPVLVNHQCQDVMNEAT
jgi:hypothetical protein